MQVVTGGCGFIGSHLVQELLAQGHHVSVIDLQPWKYEPHPNLHVVIGDIRDDIQFVNVDRVFHLAALADIVPSIENPTEYYETNVTGTLNVLQAAVKSGCKKFIYAASSSCYGTSGVTHEYDDCNPRYPYALTKYLGEQLVMHWAQVYKLPAISLRLFNVYGLRHRSNGAYGAMFGTFLAQKANGQPLTVIGDGKQERDFVHVSDVVRAFCAAADSSHIGQIYNIGSGNPSSVLSIANMISDHISFIPKRPGEPDVTHAANSKAWRDMKWNPKVSIEDGVAELLANIDAYKDCPVWEPDSIAKATEKWFEVLS